MKSFFTSIESGLAAQRFLDPKRPSALPLIYMGEDQEFPVQPDEVCERWSGPSGEHIYLVHLADDDKWYGFAGGDVIRRQKDPGRVYFYLTSAEEYWAITGLLSIIKAHAGKRLFSLTTLQSDVPLFEHFIVPEDRATSVEAAEISWIRSRPQHNQRNALSIRLDFADRFLAKLALGLGHNLFGESYINGTYADQLRQLLWRKPSEDMPNVYGTGFWQQPLSAGLSQIISIPGAWAIVLCAVEKSLALSLLSPSGREMAICISDDITPFDEAVVSEYFHGMVYYMIPVKSIFAGPFQIARVLAHRNGTRVDSELAVFDAMKTTPGILPAKR